MVISRFLALSLARYLAILLYRSLSLVLSLVLSLARARALSPPPQHDCSKRYKGGNTCEQELGLASVCSGEGSR